MIARRQPLDVIAGIPIGRWTLNRTPVQPPASCASCGCTLSIYRNRWEIRCAVCDPIQVTPMEAGARGLL